MASGLCCPSDVSMADRRIGRSGCFRSRFRAITVFMTALTVFVSLALVVSGARPTMAQGASDTLIFAGCDANVPVTRLLSRIFMRRHPNVRIRIDTVGSTNGVALAAAGTVQLGLVSRSLRDSEEGRGLTFVPYATTAVVIGAAPDAAETTITTGDLLRFYRGGKVQWPSRREIVLVTREEGDSSVATFKRVMPGFAEAYAAGSHAGHWTMTYSEPMMHEALLTIPRAIGLSDLGAITLERLPIRVLSIDGIAPTLENIASGRYPFTKTLGFVWREDTLSDSTRSFVEFVRSTDGAAVLTASGYLPAR